MRKNAICLLFLTSLVCRNAKADLFGGDVAVLSQILLQTIKTVYELKNIVETGEDTLRLMRDINSGLRSGIFSINISNPNFKAGVYGNLKDKNSVLFTLQSVYGRAPEGMDKELINSQDESVAEVISMNRNLYDYADQVDREKDKILYHAQQVSPQGAGKLQNQALGILIGVSTQLLRTQSQLLKIMAQNMAYETRKEKLATRNFQENYQGLSRGFQSLPRNSALPRLGGSR